MKLKQAEHDILVEVFVKSNFNRFKTTSDGDENVVFCLQQPIKGKVNK